MKSFIFLLLLSGIAHGSDNDPTDRREGRTINNFDAEKDVKMEIYTKSKGSFESYNRRHINSKWPTVIFIHGYFAGYMHTKLQNAYFEGENPAEVNLIRVNWVDGASHIRYKISANRSEAVGKYVGKFIHDNPMINLTSITLVGHSLGAHAAGYAGRTFTALSQGKMIPEIIGLDPARPAFEIPSPFQDEQRTWSNNAQYWINWWKYTIEGLMDLTSKLGLGLITDFLDKEKVFNKNTGLNRTDAEKVLIIHTNPGGFGFLKKFGHDDIYFNYDHAAECKISFFSAFGVADYLCNYFKVTESELASLCDHGFVNEYYANAIKDCRMNSSKDYQKPYECLKNYSESGKIKSKYQAVVNPIGEPVIADEPLTTTFFSQALSTVSNSLLKKYPELRDRIPKPKTQKFGWK